MRWMCAIRYADLGPEVQHVSKFHRDIESTGFLSDKRSPDGESARYPLTGRVALPGLAGQVGQPLEGDRQVAAVGGVAGLVVGELPRDVEGLLVQVAGASLRPAARARSASLLKETTGRGGRWCCRARRRRVPGYAALLVQARRRLARPRGPGRPAARRRPTGRGGRWCCRARRRRVAALMSQGLLVQVAGAVALPGLAGQVGQLVEGDRQVAAVGGVARVRRRRVAA